MKRLLTTLAAVGLAAALAGHAQAAGEMAKKGMPMATSEAKTGHATGVVTAVDHDAKTVTIQHGPIAGVGWPAMTMTFKANPPALTKGVKPGDKVAFDVRVQGDSNEVVALRRQ
jgi:Cu(I)/Ag(I) efflux system protein CusF